MALFSPWKRHILPRRRWSLELLESRLALTTTFTVTSLSDWGTSDPDYDPMSTVLTLRAAIELANTTSGDDIIIFNLGSGPQTIDIYSELPPINESLTIAGSNPASSAIQINGSGAGTGAHGFVINASSVIIMNLSIVNFDGDGVHMSSVDTISIFKNQIGLEWDDTLGGNGGSGIYADDVQDLVIHDNVISANTASGVHITGEETNDVFIYANTIGLDSAGLLHGFGNGESGVLVDDNATGVAIGSLVDSTAASGGGIGGSAQNIISGNGGDGITVRNVTTNYVSLQFVTISSNIIGLNSAGAAIDSEDAAVGNVGDGIRVDNSIGVIIGGLNGEDESSVPFANNGNLISGNLQNGIRITGDVSERTEFVYITRNLIGVDSTAEFTRPNQHNGILVEDYASPIIGTYVDGDGDGSLVGNVIAGNTQAGVAVVNVVGSLEDEEDVKAVNISANRIGLNEDDDAIGNGGPGVLVDNSSVVLVGGHSAPFGNIISGNNSDGVRIQGEDSEIVYVLWNLIGTNAGGTSEVSNDGHGVLITGGTQIGAAGNLISGNTEDGIRIEGDNAHPLSDIRIQGNTIGLTNNGEALPNEGNGVQVVNTFAFQENPDDPAIVGAFDIFIGTDLDGLDDATEGNVIAGNSGWGVRIEDSSWVYSDDPDSEGDDFVVKESVRIAGNLIGITENDVVRANYGGVLLANSSGVIVGGGSANARNVISGNTTDGVHIIGDVIGRIEDDPETTNIDESDYLTYGSRLLASGVANVQIDNELWSRIRIGDTESDPDVIDWIWGGATPHARRLFGIWNTAQNLVSGNYIGTNRDGDEALANHGEGVYVGQGAMWNYIGAFGVIPIDEILDDYENEDPEGVELSREILIDIDLRRHRREGNVISGNDLNGVHIEGEATHVFDKGDENAEPAIPPRYRGTMFNVVSGNFIGVKQNGLEALGNGLVGEDPIDPEVGGNGVLIDGAAFFNEVGNLGACFTTAEGFRNVISGNNSFGVFINGNLTPYYVVLTGEGGQGGRRSSGTDVNNITGNYIGVNKNGVWDEHGDIGNELGGIKFAGNQATNYVGTDPVWGGLITPPLGISNPGGPHNRNIIAGNGGPGVWIENVNVTNGAERSSGVRGNWIGIDINGNPLGNDGEGILVENSLYFDIGGLLPAETRNVISANKSDGIKIVDSSYIYVRYNYIGVTPDGTSGSHDPDEIGNEGDGIHIIGTYENPPEPDSLDPGPEGVHVGISESLFDAYASSENYGRALDSLNFAPFNDPGKDWEYWTDQLANYGSNSDGAFLDAFRVPDLTQELHVGHLIYRIYVGDATFDRDDYLVRNIIANNGTQGALLSPGSGIQVENSPLVTIHYNFIGLDALGAAAGNGGDGILITGNASDGNLVFRNTISANGDNGISVDQNAIDNVLSENSIFDNIALGISLANGGNVERSPLEIISATLVGNDLEIELDWDDAGSASFPITIELFHADSSSSGEGKTFVESVVDSSNTYPKTLTFSGVGASLDPIAVNDWIVLTITDDNGNTSSFSVAAQVS